LIEFIRVIVICVRCIIWVLSFRIWSIFNSKNLFMSFHFFVLNILCIISIFNRYFNSILIHSW
jgi:hypothetical protein